MAKKTTHKDNKREKILEAALQVIHELGASHLTFDSLAKQSGITRSGIIYYFPSKESILQGLLDEYLRISEEQITEQWEKLGKKPEMLLEAEVRCAIEDDYDDSKLNSALLAAVVDNPKMLDGARAIMHERYEAMRDNPLGFEMAALILLALDSFYLMQILQLEPLKAKDRKRIMKYMLKLAQDKEQS